MSRVEVFALGGVGEIGKNCYVVRQDNDIVVVDCGLAFPNEEMLGVDIVIPDFTYLIENKEQVRGIFLTHAHEDHVGSLPYLLQKANFPVYAGEFTHALIRSKLEERLPIKSLKLEVMRPGHQVQAGAMRVEPIRVTHSVPETHAMAVHTSHGVVLFTSDFKFDFTPVDGKLSQLNRFAELGQEGVVALLSDSTNVERSGWGPSERAVSAGLRKVMQNAPGRVLLTTFASNIHRLQQAIDVAHECGRKVAIVGRRMENNVDVCSRMGYLRIPSGARIALNEMAMYEDHQILILTTGSQGEPMSALVQMSKGEYGRMQIREGDTLIYSARPIPGNEAAIWRTINRLYRQGAHVVYDGEVPVHVSGHAYAEELKMMINLTQPFYLAPVHGEPRHQHRYCEMARNMGYPEHRIFILEDGVPLVIEEKTAYLGPAYPCGRVLVDNGGNPGITDEVLRDRYNMANDGIVAVTVAIDPEHHEVVGEPVLQGRGFNGPEGTLERTRDALLDLLNAMDPSDLIDVDRVRHEVATFVRRDIQKRTQLRPLVAPTVLEV